MDEENKLNDEQIIEVINRIIGKIEPYGSCEIDNEREKNLKLYADITYYMVGKLCDISLDKDSYMGSVSYMGKFAYDSIYYIQDLINDYMENENEET